MAYTHLREIVLFASLPSLFKSVDCFQSTHEITIYCYYKLYTIISPARRRQWRRAWGGVCLHWPQQGETGLGGRSQ